MKTAHCHYRFANTDRHLYAYFDVKAFDSIVPALNSTEQAHFIYQICDSLALALPKGVDEKHLYIKKALRLPQTLHLFCTDGFLIDINLTIPIYEQPFQTERIQITETGPLPLKARLNADILKAMQDKLFLFEEEKNKLMLQYALPSHAEEKISIQPAPLPIENKDTTMVLPTEILALKKEIIEIANSCLHALTDLLTTAEATHQHIANHILQSKTTLQTKHTDLLQQYSIVVITHYCPDFLRECALLKEKITAITPLAKQFENDIQHANTNMLEKINAATTFKKTLIDALHQAAKEYLMHLHPRLQQASAHNKKLLIHEFNRQFDAIASLDSQGVLDSTSTQQDALMKMSLAQIQKIISDEDKERPGLLQKCNTSWTEETPALKIILKYLNQLNAIYHTLFATNPDMSHKDMIEIIRIPFPRGFQFKFTKHAFAYMQSIDVFYKEQKAHIAMLAKTYKKFMQIDDIINKTNWAIKEAEDLIQPIREMVEDYHSFLAYKEESHEIMAVADQVYLQTRSALAAAQQSKQFLFSQTDKNEKILNKKIHTLILHITQASTDASKKMQSLSLLKTDIDAIKHDPMLLLPKEKLFLLSEKILLMKDCVNKIDKDTSQIHAATTALKRYQQAASMRDMIETYTPNNIHDLLQKAKNMIHHFIKQQMQGYGETSAERKEKIAQCYSQLNLRAEQIFRTMKTTSELKMQLYKALNHKRSVLSDTDFDKHLTLLQNHLAEVATKTKEITQFLDEIEQLV